MEKTSKIYIAGHNGLVGSALKKKFLQNGFDNLILKTRSELDLTRQSAVEDFFKNHQPEYVIIAAAMVGGIKTNMERQAEFLYNNLMIQNNIIHSAYKSRVKKLLFLGSSCVYPRDCPQPMKEEYLLDGKLEPTNEAYAIAKITGIKMCEKYYEQYGANFISVMPTNVYGPNDNFDLNTSHAFPALIKKFHDAKTANSPDVEIWGTGNSKREFLYVDDLADAILYLMQNYHQKEFINIGTGEDLSIRELAYLIRDIIGYKGKIRFNTEKPDGMPRKLLDVSRLTNLGWKYKVPLSEGIRLTHEYYKTL